MLNFHRFAAITSIKPISVSHIDTLKCFGYLLYLKKRNKVYCMHIDCDELITKAQIEGFKVVEIK